ncbi:MAG: hypothetical protein HQL74_12740 [Magnetococcales bacterium]|nr:hypothetical protein [Magnetococcales bacterium]
MWEDPIVEEIRKVREEHAARFNYDLDAIYQDLIRMQQESGREYVDLSRKPDQEAASPIDNRSYHTVKPCA